MVEIVEENGKINYEQALQDLQLFLYGRKSAIDKDLHLKDIQFYLSPKNLLFSLRSFSFTIIPKVLNIWMEIGYKNLHRYFQLSVIAVINKLKEREEARKPHHR
ncbi:MAG: hypothetical protein ACTSQI_13195 [Candidatus Helarchaeota archaeon]